MTDLLKLQAGLQLSSTIPMELNFGLPWLEIVNEELCIRFKPHRVVFREKTNQFYAPMYEAAWLYPFKGPLHLIYFERKFYPSGDLPLLCERSQAQMLEFDGYHIEDLYKTGSKVLSFREAQGRAGKVIVSEYQEKFREVVHRMEMEALYF